MDSRSYMFFANKGLADVRAQPYERERTDDDTATRREWPSTSANGSAQQLGAHLVQRLAQLAEDLERAPVVAKEGAAEYRAAHPGGIGAAYERGWLEQQCKGAAAELRQLLALLVVALVVVAAGCASEPLEVTEQAIDCAAADGPAPTAELEAKATGLVWVGVLGMTGKPALTVHWSTVPTSQGEVIDGSGAAMLTWRGAYQCTPSWAVALLVWRRVLSGQAVGAAVVARFDAVEAADQERAQATLVNARL